MSEDNLNGLWGRLIIEELIRNSVGYFCLSPGSRSTPLVVAVAAAKKAEADKIKVVMHYDERGAAFNALGYARASGRPAAVICTSGTAAANYLPAVIEASIDNIPLIVLTADRPPELRDTGANQTIDQVKIYGDYVRWQFDLPCPDPKIDPAMVLTTIDQAIYRSRRSPAGPVHLNCMFREPLAPAEEDGGSWDHPSLEKLTNWKNSGKAYTGHTTPRATIDDNDLATVAKSLRSAKHPLLLVGHLENREQQQAVLELSRALNQPTFADIRSGLRLADERHIIPHYDLILHSRKFASTHRPDVVLHLGGRFVSKRLEKFLSETRPGQYVHLSDSKARLDASHSVTHKLEGDISDSCHRLTSLVGRADSDKVPCEWQQASKVVGDLIARQCDSTSNLTEAAIARHIAEHLPANNDLFVASSMPVRDLDMFAAPGRGMIHVGANRGASGIDGTIASAVGYAAGRDRPVTLVIGDLAFLHDLNSLAMLKGSKQPVTIVLLNNSGGGIFEMLPIARFNQLCRDYFVTEHDLTFANAAAMFNLPYVHIDGKGAFGAAYSEAAASGDSSIIEVTIDRKQNIDFHHRLLEKIVTTLDNL